MKKVLAMDEPKADLYPAMRGSREYWDAKREAELVALRAERDQFKAMWERDSTALGKALAQRDTARVDAEDKRARVAELEADAARWRMLRRQEGVSVSMTYDGNTGATTWMTGDELDQWADDERNAVNKPASLSEDR